MFASQLDFFSAPQSTPFLHEFCNACFHCTLCWRVLRSMKAPSWRTAALVATVGKRNMVILDLGTVLGIPSPALLLHSAWDCLWNLAGFLWVCWAFRFVTTWQKWGYPRGVVIVQWVDKAKQNEYVVQARDFLEFFGRLGFIAQLLVWLKLHLPSLFSWAAVTVAGTVWHLPRYSCSHVANFWRKHSWYWRVDPQSVSLRWDLVPRSFLFRYSNQI